MDSPKYHFDVELFSERLKKIRKYSKITQDNLAFALKDDCGLYREKIIAFENGRAIPTIVELTSLSNHFSVRIDYLLGRFEYSDETWRISKQMNEPLEVAEKIVKSRSSENGIIETPQIDDLSELQERYNFAESTVIHFKQNGIHDQNFLASIRHLISIYYDNDNSQIMIKKIAKLLQSISTDNIAPENFDQVILFEVFKSTSATTQKLDELSKKLGE